ncbi:DUF2971 domain-containing protein [Hymenobacter sp. GOD-10R]|uniref:DUF2971 domain-containing protein n=1 Tax=Hymenobacter sp. GOD-10R TaxID=3093922 RepID=UPI002D77770B|nr:DUF2971 domain-containing protein [Hymenobacter sp. GOD-10R]WRQ27096.1 DUF2971 domain-containing protein [Hymenobacter sp. GOD-10R]
MDFPQDLNKLYHYSSPAGLMGIVRSKSLWFTNIHYQNDIEEYTYAYKLTKQIVDSEYQGFGYNDYINGAVTAVFTFSLSENDDQLSQWRGYCPTGGFSFSFDSEQLEEVITDNGLTLQKCIYDKQEQIAYIKAKIIGFTPAEWAKALEEHEQGNSSRYYNCHRSIREMPKALAQAAAIMKHEKFGEEAEWRLIKTYFDVRADIFTLNGNQTLFFKRDTIKFREAKDILIPYVEIPLVKNKEADPLKLSTIVVGPGPRQDLALQSCTYLGHDLHAITKVSLVPYRNW